VNAFYTSHNPSVYEDPFTIKPERFLDEHGAVVAPGHPARHKYVFNKFSNITYKANVLQTYFDEYFRKLILT